MKSFIATRKDFKHLKPANDSHVKKAHLGEKKSDVSRFIASPDEFVIISKGKGLHEDAPTNAVGSGAIAGTGVGPQGEPGVKPTASKKKKEILRRYISEKNSSFQAKAKMTYHDDRMNGMFAAKDAWEKDNFKKGTFDTQEDERKSDWMKKWNHKMDRHLLAYRKAKKIYGREDLD